MQWSPLAGERVLFKSDLILKRIIVVSYRATNEYGRVIICLLLLDNIMLVHILKKKHHLFVLPKDIESLLKLLSYISHLHDYVKRDIGELCTFYQFQSTARNKARSRTVKESNRIFKYLLRKIYMFKYICPNFLKTI